MVAIFERLSVQESKSFMVGVQKHYELLKVMGSADSPGVSALAK